MKRLNLYQISDLADYLAENDDDDEEDIKAVNMTLKILGYTGRFRYDEDRGSIIWNGAINRERKNERSKEAVR